MRRRARSTVASRSRPVSCRSLVPAVARAQPPTAGSEVKVTPAPPPESLPVAGAPQPPPAPPPPAPARPRRRRRRARRAEAAPAAPPAEAKPPNPPAGYVPGTGFVIQSPDLNYRMRIGLVGGVQVRADLRRRRVAAAQHLLRAAPLPRRQLLPRLDPLLDQLRVRGQPALPARLVRRVRPLEAVHPARRPAVDAVRSPRVLRPAGDPVPRVGARQRVLLVGPRQGRHRARYAGRAARLLPRASTQGRRCVSTTRCRATTCSRHASPGTRSAPRPRPSSRTSCPRAPCRSACRRRCRATTARCRARRRTSTRRRSASKRGDRRNDAADRGRRGLLAADAVALLLRRRVRPPDRAVHGPRGTRRSASGGRSACRSSPRRWTSRPASTGSTPASTSAATTSTRSRDSSRTTSRTRRGWS